MTEQDLRGELDSRFSSPEAVATKWEDARNQLETAELYFLSTVRPDGRPHVTPLISVWLDEAPWFVTGPTERKAMNLSGNPHCVLTTGCNDLNQGLDVIVEGEAVGVTDEVTLQQVADAFTAKYPDPFKFTINEFQGGGGGALVFRIEPSRAFAFRHLPVSSQTRWDFLGSADATFAPVLPPPKGSP